MDKWTTLSSRLSIKSHWQWDAEGLSAHWGSRGPSGEQGGHLAATWNPVFIFSSNPVLWDSTLPPSLQSFFHWLFIFTNWHGFPPEFQPDPADRQMSAFLGLQSTPNPLSLYFNGGERSFSAAFVLLSSCRWGSSAQPIEEDEEPLLTT